MKRLLVILLIAIATCAAIEESFDDDVVLEKSLLSKITPKKIIDPKKVIDPKKLIIQKKS